MNNSSQKLRQSIKGASIKKAGFLTGIHALVPEVKNRLDELLRFSYSPVRVLKQLSQEFPNTNLPSKSALYVYKNTYLDKEMNTRDAEVFDEEKVKVKSLLLTHVKRFLAIDLPTIRNAWQDDMQKAQESGKITRETREATKLYLDTVKLCTELVPRLNINIELKEENESADNAASSQDDDVYKDLDRLISQNKRQLEVMLRRNPEYQKYVKSRNL